MKNWPKAFTPVLMLLIWAQSAYAAEEGAPPVSGDAHGLEPLVLVGLAAMLVVAKLGGELFERMKQPAVLGELIGGIIIGNLVLLGFTAAEPLKTNEVIAAIAEVGVIILLFEVGLESDLKEMMEVGWSSLLVAVLGVISPFFWAGLCRFTSFRINRDWRISSSGRRCAPRALALQRGFSKILGN